MTAELPPRIIALAIAALAADRVRAAWRDLEAWRVLGLAGVPLLDIRHALETPEALTEPLTHVREWEQRDSRGMLVEHGVPGTGKTYSAVKWLLGTLDRNLNYPHLRGLTMCWLAASTWPYQDRKLQDAWLKRGEAADRLVLDDIGAGASAAAWTREPMEGMLMNRLAAGRSTMLVSNANALDLRSWLGPRLVDRISMGGRIIEIKSKKSMRAPDETELDADGHSPTWHANAAIVGGDYPGRGQGRDVKAGGLGCRRLDGATLEVGHVLEAAVERASADARRTDDAAEAKRIAWKPCVDAQLLLGLDGRAMHARGLEIDARERRVLGELSEQYKIDIPAGGFTVDTAMQAVEQLLARGKPAPVAAAPLNRRPIIVPAHVAGDAVDAARDLCLTNGIHVKRNPSGLAFQAVRWSDDPSNPIGRFDVVADGQPSEGQGWLAGAMVLRDEQAPECGEAVAS
jgi:hypothetical protein